MEEMTKPTLSDRTAHLCNALRILEIMQQEVYDAYAPAGEDRANAALEAIGNNADYIKKVLEGWISDEVHDWAISEPRRAEI